MAINDHRTTVIAFVERAGFSAVTEVFGDETALKILDVFEAITIDLQNPICANRFWPGSVRSLGVAERHILFAIDRVQTCVTNAKRVPN